MKMAVVLTVVGLSLGWVDSAWAGATGAEVETAIANAKKWIYSQQKNDCWEVTPTAPAKRMDDNKPEGGMWGGRTALAVYTLLDAGENPREEKLAPAIDFLKKADIQSTYGLALRCQAWLLLPKTPENMTGLRKDAALLVNGMKKTAGAPTGLWGYTVFPTPKGTYSHSRSQYAVLGLWAAAQRDIETPIGAWQIIENVWLRNQDASGGWTYMAPRDTKHPCTPGMTAAGVATLFLTAEAIHVGDARNPAAPAIEKGLEWLTKNADKYASDKGYDRDFPFATMYTFQRAAQASGYKYLGGADWHERGTSFALRNQQKDGHWDAKDAMGSLADTCFATLFLVHGRAPVIFNKLEYAITPEGNAKPRDSSWNQRPRDIATVTRWVGRQMEKRVSWQIVPLNAPLDDLQESSILCISGKDALAFTPEETAKLKAYVQSGGIILGMADGSSDIFSKSFRQLGTALFGGEFRQLPDNHPIYTRQQFPFAPKDRRPNIDALTNGVRELMLLVPSGDPGLMWQGNRTAAGADMFNFAADLSQYAVDRQYRYRSETHVVAADPKITTAVEIKVARIKYDGNWDPEPAAWRRMAAIMRNTHKIKLTVETVDLGSSLDSYAVAHLTGTEKRPLPADKIESLKAFVARGGVLIVDAAGGNEAFANSAVRDLSVAFAETMGELPESSTLVQSLKKLDGPVYRRFARSTLGNAVHLFGAEDKGKVKMVISALDLTAGLMGQPVDGISGYEPAAAVAIVERCLLGTLPPATAPKAAATSAPK